MHPTTSDTLADLAQNAFEAGATDVRVELARRGACLEVAVQDNGCGMDAATARKALDPFWTDGAKHPGRRVGLGLPFAKHQAELCGGTFALDSAPGRGTTVRLVYALAHVDAPPPGDVAGTLAGLMAWPGRHELVVRREVDGRAYEARRSELAAALGGLEDAGALALLKEFFTAHEAEIGNEVQDGKAHIG